MFLEEKEGKNMDDCGWEQVETIFPRAVQGRPFSPFPVEDAALDPRNGIREQSELNAKDR